MTGAVVAVGYLERHVQHPAGMHHVAPCTVAHAALSFYTYMQTDSTQLEATALQCSQDHSVCALVCLFTQATTQA